jgi:3-hydroxyisobutyrate dehydrogenase-like beta-hydroxyacid dehydrogenase
MSDSVKDPDAAKAPVGLVGLGAMGRPAARHLAAAGHPTFCFDPDDAATQAVAADGIRAAASLSELAAVSSVVLILVPSDGDVIEVCDPSAGLLAGARSGTVFLVCSSVRPDTCQAVAAMAAERGVDVLDAALTGGVRAAEAGTVNLLVGGDAAVLDRIRPSLRPWTGTVHHLGQLGAGQVGKTVNNLCHWGQLAAIVEALRLGRALGVEPSALRAAVMDGPADSRTLREMQLMRLTWYAKDLVNAFAMADSADQDLPVARVVREAMNHISVDDIAELYQPRSTITGRVGAR